MFCIYCARDKGDDEFSDEHVIPKAIGGNVFPMNPFLLRRVCKACNSRCGAYVDGPFIRSWFTQNTRVQETLRYFDISQGPVVPLSFMGKITLESTDRRECDFWLGPTGDLIYHFHHPYPEEPNISPMAGIPTFARQSQIDSGYVFLTVKATNSTWHPTIVKSVQAQFPSAELYLVNGPTPAADRFKDIPDYLRDLHSVLQQPGTRQHQVQIAFRPDFGDRFIAKTALGLGSLFLDAEFEHSPDACLLRQFMWTKDSESRNAIPIQGARLFSQEQRQLDFLDWPGAHLVQLMPVGDRLAMRVVFYGKFEATMNITCNPNHWRALIPDQEGFVYIIHPGLQKVVGPVNLTMYIAWKQHLIEHSELQSLWIAAEKVPELPPYDMPGI